MKLIRLFSSTPESEDKGKEKDKIANESIASGSALAGLGLTAKVLKNKIDKLPDEKLIKINGKITKIYKPGPDTLKALKTGGNVLIPVGLTVAAGGTGYKAYKKFKKKKEEGNDNKA